MLSRSSFTVLLGLLLSISSWAKEPTPDSPVVGEQFDRPITAAEAKELRRSPPDEADVLLHHPNAYQLEASVDGLRGFVDLYFQSLMTAGERDAFVELLLTGKTPRQVIVMGHVLDMLVRDKYKSMAYPGMARGIAAQERFSAAMRQLADMEVVGPYWSPPLLRVDRDGKPQPLTSEESLFYAKRRFYIYCMENRDPDYDIREPIVTVKGDVTRYDWNADKEAAHIRVTVSSSGTVAVLKGSAIPKN